MEGKGPILPPKVFDRIIFTARIIFNFSDVTTILFIKSFT